MAPKTKRLPYTPITLRDLRTRVYGERQEDFARRIGVGVPTLQSWERRSEPKVPRFKTRHKIADALGIDYADIAWPERDPKDERAAA